MSKINLKIHPIVLIQQNFGNYQRAFRSTQDMLRPNPKLFTHELKKKGCVFTLVISPSYC